MGQYFTKDDSNDHSANNYSNTSEEGSVAPLAWDVSILKDTEYKAISQEHVLLNQNKNEVISTTLTHTSTSLDGLAWWLLEYEDHVMLVTIICVINLPFPFRLHE